MEHNHSSRYLILLPFFSLLASCTGSPSTLSPASTTGVVISDLMWLAFGIAGVVFLIVESLLLISILKFRRRGNEAVGKNNLPVQNEGNKIFETAWTIAPAIVLAIVFYVSVVAYQSVRNVPNPSNDAPVDAQPINIRVLGYQWWWKFEYPDLKIKTANEYHVPVNSVITLSVEAGDVIHSYWVPQLGRKIDAIPGHINHTWFKAIETGIFTGECAELCGEEHAEMRFQVVVDTPEEFQNWVKQQQSLPPKMTGLAAKGEQIFMQGSCKTCHTIDGTNARGQFGPDLTHVASRQIIAGGIMEFNVENMTKWLENPPAVKPGTKMPNLGLTKEQISALVAFISSLK